MSILWRKYSFPASSLFLYVSVWGSKGPVGGYRRFSIILTCQQIPKEVLARVENTTMLGRAQTQ